MFVALHCWLFVIMHWRCHNTLKRLITDKFIKRMLWSIHDMLGMRIRCLSLCIILLLNYCWLRILRHGGKEVWPSTTQIDGCDTWKTTRGRWWMLLFDIWDREWKCSFEKWRVVIILHILLFLKWAQIFSRCLWYQSSLLRWNHILLRLYTLNLF